MKRGMKYKGEIKHCGEIGAKFTFTKHLNTVLIERHASISSCYILFTVLLI